MKVKDILNTKCTVLGTMNGWNNTYTSYTQRDFTITDIIKLGYKYREQIEKLRSLPYHSDEQKAFKEQFPVWFPCGTFPFKKTHDTDIITYSNILAIDIDKSDNMEQDLDDVAAKIFDLPYVFAVLKSISGQGYYALILVEDGRFTDEYYNYLTKLFSQKYGILADTQCKNIARKRVLSYEDDIDLWIKNDEIDITPWKLRKTTNKEQTITHKESFNPKDGLYDNSFDKQRLSKAIWYLLNDGLSVESFNSTNQYGLWYHIGCDFKYFEDGEAMFIKFSQNSSKYNDNLNTIINKFNNCQATINESDLARKYFGMMKTKYGKRWHELIKEAPNLFTNI